MTRVEFLALIDEFDDAEGFGRVRTRAALVAAFDALHEGLTAQTRNFLAATDATRAAESRLAEVRGALRRLVDAVNVCEPDSTEERIRQDIAMDAALASARALVGTAEACRCGFPHVEEGGVSESAPAPENAKRFSFSELLRQEAADRGEEWAQENSLANCAKCGKPWPRVRMRSQADGEWICGLCFERAITKEKP